jgi:O-methyltransferase involved in polyketide biosynthesis
VPVDFETDDLATALTVGGFDTEAPVVFVWEGVTNYLTAEAVDATLAMIHALARRGGLLVGTHVDARALREPNPFPEARRWLRAVERAGEPWTFGLMPADTARFLADRGFRLREDVSTFEAGRTWFAGRDRRERGSRLTASLLRTSAPGRGPDGQDQPAASSGVASPGSAPATSSSPAASSSQGRFTTANRPRSARR